MLTDLSVGVLLVQDDEPPLHLPAVLSLVLGEREDDRPILVEPVAGTPFFRIRNGRHRFVAALALQRATVRCQIREASHGR